MTVRGANGCTATSSVTVAQDSCTPGISIEKLTNGREVAVILGSPGNMPAVTWTYEVTNTGDVDLTDVVVNDDQEGQVCVIASLPVGATETCSLTGQADMINYTNIATVTGLGNGQTVTDQDQSSYIGVGINVEKIADRTEVCPGEEVNYTLCLLYTSPSPRDATLSRMPSSA